MTHLTTQIERDCPSYISDFVSRAAATINLTAETFGLKLDEDALLGRIYRHLSDRYVLRDCFVYQGGHHVAVCQGQRRLALITVAAKDWVCHAAEFDRAEA